MRNFHFDGNLTCGERSPALVTTSIDFTFTKFSSPYEWIPGMDGAKRIAAEAGFDEGFVIVWSEMFATWVTDKVISQEVVRNLILALICVMGMTSFLIAEPQTCVWILLCVLLTLLDVCGFMYYWGLTIDIVSCIGNILSNCLQKSRKIIIDKLRKKLCSSIQLVRCNGLCWCRTYYCATHKADFQL